jgi:30S ribosomal protein S31
MGKGDRKSKRGKIWRGTTGKRRPGSQKLRKLRKERAATATAGKS